MAFWNSKKKTYVSSQVYSLAGEYKYRQNYKKANLLSIINRMSEGGDFGEHLFKTINSSQLSSYRKFNMYSNKLNYWGQTGQIRPLLEIPPANYELTIKSLLEEYLGQNVNLYEVSTRIWELKNELVLHFYENSKDNIIISDLKEEHIFNHLNNLIVEQVNYFEINNRIVREEYLVEFEVKTKGKVGDKGAYPANSYILDNKSNDLNIDLDSAGSLVVYLATFNDEDNTIINKKRLFSSQSREYGKPLGLRYNKLLIKKTNNKNIIEGINLTNNDYVKKENIVMYFTLVKKINPDDFGITKTIEKDPFSFELNLYNFSNQRKSTIKRSEEVLVEYIYDKNEVYIKNELGELVLVKNPPEIELPKTIKKIIKDNEKNNIIYNNTYLLKDTSKLDLPRKIELEAFKLIKLSIEDTIDGDPINYGKYLNEEFLKNGLLEVNLNDETYFVKPNSYRFKEEDVFFNVIKYQNYSNEKDLYEESYLNHIMYTKGSGNSTLDSILNSINRVSLNTAPVMPIRLYKRNIINNNYPKIANLNNKLFNVLTRGNNYKDLVKSINKSSGIGDIENGYIIQGIPITTRDPLCKEYLWTFFSEISGHANGSNTVNIYEMISEENTLKFLNGDSYGSYYVTAEGKEVFKPNEGEDLIRYVSLKNFFTSNPKNVSINLKMGSTWSIGTNLNFYVESVGIRVIKGSYSNMKNNEIRLVGDTIKIPTSRVSSSKVSFFSKFFNSKRDILTLIKQEKNFYTCIDLVNPKYENEVKPGYWTGASGRGVFNYNSEECPMIIPLNNEILNRMPVLSAIQVAANCSHIVFNTWKVVKEKFFQRGVFKVVMVVAAVVVSIYFPPFGAAAGGAGILGANLAVGIAMGLAGTAAIIGGAIANAIAAVVVSHIISKAIDKVFDGTLAIIVKMIANYAVAQIGSNTTFMDSLKDSFDNFLDISNIIKGTDALANIYQNNKMGKLQARQEDFINTMNEFQSKAEEMKKNMEELGFENSNFELANIYIDSNTQIPNEAPEDFLARTLLTGSDIIEQSLRMIDSYVEIQLQQNEV